MPRFSTSFWIDNNGESFESFERTAVPPPQFHLSETAPGWDPDAAREAIFTVDGVTARVEIVNRLKSGKEATVFCCVARSETGDRLLAAKFFKEMSERSFKNDAIYLEGRFPRRWMARAVRAGADFGREMRFASWVQREFHVLSRLSAAGADVPRPYLLGERYILMEYLGTAEASATLLQRTRLAPHQARPVFDRVLANIELFLAHDVVHGDLSAFNVLWDGARGMIIDFPQAVDPRHNSSAESLLHRDVANVCRHFARYGLHESAAEIAGGLWSRYTRGAL